MSDTSPPPRPHVPSVARISMSDIKDVLALGLRDFRAAPQFGAFFSLVYVIGGIALVALGAGTMTWTLVLSLGFPLIAPFAAVGLYEVSRRLEAGQALDWGGVLGVVLAERKRQVPWIGAIIVIAFLFWTFLAHMIFALFMGLSAMTNISSSYEAFLTGNGLSMLAVEALVGDKSGDRAGKKPGGKSAKSDAKDADTRAVEKTLADALGLKGDIRHQGDESGTVAISYKSLAQLDGVIARLLSNS